MPEIFHQWVLNTSPGEIFDLLLYLLISQITVSRAALHDPSCVILHSLIIGHVSILILVLRSDAHRSFLAIEHSSLLLLLLVSFVLPHALGLSLGILIGATAILCLLLLNGAFHDLVEATTAAI